VTEVNEYFERLEVRIPLCARPRAHAPVVHTRDPSLSVSAHPAFAHDAGLDSRSNARHSPSHAGRRSSESRKHYGRTREAWAARGPRCPGCMGAGAGRAGTASGRTARGDFRSAKSGGERGHSRERRDGRVKLRCARPYRPRVAFTASERPLIILLRRSEHFATAGGIRRHDHASDASASAPCTTALVVGVPCDGF
jgi:hypothetical protein